MFGLTYHALCVVCMVSGVYFRGVNSAGVGLGRGGR